MSVEQRRRWLHLASLTVLNYNRIKENEKKKHRRRYWVKDWLDRRSDCSHVNLIKELCPEDYNNYLRMPEVLYEELLSMIIPLIKKKDTHMRQSISPHERLTVTLRYLATGRSYTDLQYSSIISKQALSVIIPETCEAIFKVLKEEYMKVSV
jgi:hypothetical protein